MLQAERDDLMLHLIFTKGVTEDLQTNVKVMKNVKSKVGAEKSRAEEQKLKQVRWAASSHVHATQPPLADFQADARGPEWNSSPRPSGLARGASDEGRREAGGADRAVRGSDQGSGRGHAGCQGVTVRGKLRYGRKWCGVFQRELGQL